MVLARRIVELDIKQDGYFFCEGIQLTEIYDFIGDRERLHAYENGFTTGDCFAAQCTNMSACYSFSSKVREACSQCGLTIFFTAENLLRGKSYFSSWFKISFALNQLTK